MLSYLILFLSMISLHATPMGDVMDSTVGIYVEYPAYMSQNPNVPNQAFGSGVILSEDGLIVTNQHVIQSADKIIVQTHDGQKEFAQVVGSAPEFDLAIIKINTLPNQPLTPIRFGKSCDIRQGDKVTAVGNSFGFEQTLTQGVVSHIDRDVRLSHRVSSYLQVDAAINPGNSGGALVNEKGELVGVVSGIYGPRMNIGIGFAIPIDVAKPVIQQLVSKGYVNSGWIGMATQSLTPELKDAINAQEYDGILISEVIPGSPAHKASLLPKDVILSVNDIKVNSPQHFASLVTAHGSHSLLSVNYLRENKTYTTKIKTDQPSAIGGTDLGHWGMNLTEFYHLSLDGVVGTGVQVNQISSNSNGALSGLRPGDIIKAINDQPVKTLNDISSNQLKKHKTNLLEISRNEQTFFVPIR